MGTLRHRLPGDDGQPAIPRPFLFGISGSVRNEDLVDSGQLYRLAGHNTGNLAFTSAIAGQVAGWGDPLNVGWGATPDQIRSAGDICVIAAANQLGKHIDMGKVADRLEAANVPTVMISVGAQSSMDYGIPVLPDGTLRWVRTVVDRAPAGSMNVGVRGDFSRRVLAAHGFEGVRVLGCPSLFLNPAVRLGQLIERKAGAVPARVAVAAGHPGWRHLARIERSLTRMVSETDGAYVCQAPLSMMAIGYGDTERLDATELDACRTYVDSAMSAGEFRVWAKRHAVVFHDVSTWMDFLSEFDFVVGTRIHGVVLGLQAGVPALCVAFDSRTRELCETMAIPHVYARDYQRTGLDRTELLSLFRRQFDGAGFDANRSRLADAYCGFLEDNLLVPQAALKALAGRE